MLEKVLSVKLTNAYGGVILISVTQAFDVVISHSRARKGTLRSVKCLLDAPDSIVIATDLVADRDLPPFDRVAMDGIAIAHADWATGHRSFELVSMASAGAQPAPRTRAGTAIEVMTGCPLPEGTDAVIRYEDLVIMTSPRIATIRTPQLSVALMQNVHPRGADSRAGAVLVPSGRLMRAPEWAAAATVGHTFVSHPKSPRIGIIATGDELCAPQDTPSSTQIRASNLFALAASLRDRGYHDLSLDTCPDDPRRLETLVREKLAVCDILVLTGAVSAGRFDFVPGVLRQCQVDEVFHKIAQRPGKPMWFGRAASGVLVFGLPGNPVSALICAHRYLLPAAHTMCGRTETDLDRYAVLTDDVVFAHGDSMTLFLPVALHQRPDARWYATPIRGVGSGDLAHLCQSDGFIECPQGHSTQAAGTVLKIFPWGSM